MSDEPVYVVFDSKGNGRVVGVFNTEEQANEIQQVSPQYYRVFPMRVNDINPESLRWVQDEKGRERLSRLSSQTRVIVEGETEANPRIALAVAIGGIVWQVLVIEFALRSAETLRQMLSGLGAAAPAVTTAFLASHRWFPLAPIACVVPVVWAHRRGSSKAMLIAAAFALGVGLVLQVWTNEAALAPLRDMIAKLAG